MERLESMKWMSQWTPPKPIALAQLQAPLSWNCEMAKGSVLATARPQPIPQLYWTVGSADLGCHMASSWCLLWFFSMWPFFTRRLARHPSSVVSGKSFKRSRAEPARAPRVWLLQLAQRFPAIDFIVSCDPASHRTLRSPGMGKGTDCRMDEPPSHYQEMCTLLKKTSRPTIGNFPQAYQKPSLCGTSPWRYRLEEMTT